MILTLVSIVREELDSITPVITRFLSRREHSEYELVNKLVQKGYACDEIKASIAQFKAADIQSDLRFAESRIRDRAYKGYGEFWIRQELKQHQVADSVADAAFAEEPQDWFDIAKRWFNKKYARRVEELKTDWKKQQQAKVAARNRGFSQDQINYALACLFDGDDV